MHCRNSKLTMLLQDSLGGNAKALMIANLAPSPLHATETLSSLAFASKVLPEISAHLCPDHSLESHCMCSHHFTGTEGLQHLT